MEEETRTPAGVAPLEPLAAAAREREPGAFDRLATLLAPRLTGYAAGILRDRGLAEEAVQETFLRIYRFLPSYREDNFLAWSFTITARVCATIARREQRHAKLVSIVRPARAHDPMRAVRSRLDLEAALQTLPMSLRQTFLLHGQGLGYEEIGHVLDVPVGTVRSRLFRARESLRRTLGSAGERIEE